MESRAQRRRSASLRQGVASDRWYTVSRCRSARISSCIEARVRKARTTRPTRESKRVLNSAGTIPSIEGHAGRSPFCGALGLPSNSANGRPTGQYEFSGGTMGPDDHQDPPVGLQQFAQRSHSWIDGSPTQTTVRTSPRPPMDRAQPPFPSAAVAWRSMNATLRRVPVTPALQMLRCRKAPVTAL